VKTLSQVEDLRNTLGAMVEMGGTGPFTAQTRDLLGAIHNALCYVLEDGSPHADRFAKNLQNLMQWCERKGITFVQWDTTGKPVV